MAQFNTDLLKKYIAPKIDELPDVTLPDLRSEFEDAEAWMQQYFLSSVFEREFVGKNRLYAESIIARIQMTFAGYQEGRTKTHEYAQKWIDGNPGIGRYLAAIREWESVFINLQVIYDLLGKFMGVTYSAGDREERARLIANRIKHVSGDIEDGKLLGPGVPMWLTRDGFATIKVSMTFDELGQQVRMLALIANCLSQPSQARQRFAELDAKLANDPNYQPRP
jgi:hypothetical protein